MNGHGIDSCQILKHADDLRIIVPKNVQFQHTAGDGVIIEMGGDGTGNPVTILIFQIFFICRILKRREIMDIHIAWTYHDAGRVLPGGTLDPCYAGR